jgi:glycerol uptake facilitator-like aquaporin
MRKYPCKLCNRKFGTKHGLFVHNAIMHSKKKLKKEIKHGTIEKLLYAVVGTAVLMTLITQMKDIFEEINDKAKFKENAEKELHKLLVKLNVV